MNANAGMEFHHLVLALENIIIIRITADCAVADGGRKDAIDSASRWWKFLWLHRRNVWNDAKMRKARIRGNHIHRHKSAFNVTDPMAKMIILFKVLIAKQKVETMCIKWSVQCMFKMHRIENQCFAPREKKLIFKLQNIVFVQLLDFDSVRFSLLLAATYFAYINIETDRINILSDKIGTLNE